MTDKELDLLTRLETADAHIQRYAGDLYRINGQLSQTMSRLGHAIALSRAAVEELAPKLDKRTERQADIVTMHEVFMEETAELLAAIKESIAYHAQGQTDDVVELDQIEET